MKALLEVILRFLKLWDLKKDSDNLKEDPIESSGEDPEITQTQAFDPVAGQWVLFDSNHKIISNSYYLHIGVPLDDRVHKDIPLIDPNLSDDEL